MTYTYSRSHNYDHKNRKKSKSFIHSLTFVVKRFRRFCTKKMVSNTWGTSNKRSDTRMDYTRNIIISMASPLSFSSQDKNNRALQYAILSLVINVGFLLPFWTEVYHSQNLRITLIFSFFFLLQQNDWMMIRSEKEGKYSSTNS